MPHEDNSIWTIVAQELNKYFSSLPTNSSPKIVVSSSDSDLLFLKEKFESFIHDGARWGNYEKQSDCFRYMSLGEQNRDHSECSPDENLLRFCYLSSRIVMESTAVGAPPIDSNSAFLKRLPSNYVDINGNLIPSDYVASAWHQWMQGIASNASLAGIILVEDHGPASDFSTEEIADDTWSSITDCADRLLARHRIDAESLLVMAAESGLFSPRAIKRFPADYGQCSFSVSTLFKREYIIRYATCNDIDRLCEFETMCWKHTRSSRETIESRLSNYPQGQFVLVSDGVVNGVIYSQRIAEVDAIDGCNAGNVHLLHDESGSIIQLLALNVDPAVQDMAYGDQLLEFMLQRCALVAGVDRVVGVTICKKYDADIGMDFGDYIQLSGAAQDPVLAFHCAHGAVVVRSIPGYRPEDKINLCNGVLISYDILHRESSRAVSYELAAPPVVPVSKQLQCADRSAKEFVLISIAELLRIAPSGVIFDRPLMEMGLDSADLMRLQMSLEERFDINLEAGFFFEYSSARKVIEQVEKRLNISGASVYEAEEIAEHENAPISSHGIDARCERESCSDDSPHDDAIAIIGMACQFPGDADSPERLWKLLLDGVSAISSYPARRGLWPQETAIAAGGFVDAFEYFDSEFFRLSPAEARITDPQQRVLLELAWTCAEDAAIPFDMLKASGTGVFIGASNCDYSRRIQDARQEVDAHHGVGTSLAVLANRISYFFDLSGPSLLIDTACSSSLVAIHSAIRSLRAGECSMAFAGGVNLICHPDLSIAYRKAGMLSSDGLCKVFDASADGYVRSEGAGLLLLKPLSAAIADGDRIHAILRGSAINHGGLAGGLTVPNPQKQSELLIAAWADAKVAAGEITYLEAHGTGTPLGDPIEVQGMQSALSHFSMPAQGHSCPIGSIKSNLGHLESAAGIAGVIKVVQSMRHRCLPASVNFRKLNPKIRLDNSQLRIQTEFSPWKVNGPLIAGVSSFGSGGTNAHVVLQEPPVPKKPSPQPFDNLFVVSAINQERLKAYARRIVQWIDDDLSASFNDAAYTSQVSRTPMKYRLAVRATGFDDLSRKISNWLSGTTGIPGLWAGHADFESPALRVWAMPAGLQLIERMLHGRELEQVGILWVSGIEIDWRLLYGHYLAKRTGIPTYPFFREHCWLQSAVVEPATGLTRPSSVVSLHPLLHRNTSDFSRQCFTSFFNGNEPFLADHRVRYNGAAQRRVLPASACLEMARAALAFSASEPTDEAVIALEEVVWITPILVDTPVTVRIDLFDNNAEQIDFEICTIGDSQETVHCRGSALLFKAASWPETDILDLERLQAKVNTAIFSRDDLYSAFTRMGFDYGHSHRVLNDVVVGDEELLAHLHLPGSPSDLNTYLLHPGLIDGAFQAAFALHVDLRNPPEQPPLPFSIDRVEVSAPCTEKMVAWIRQSPECSGAESTRKLDVDLADADGRICVKLRGCVSRVPAGNANTSASLISVPVWKERALPASPTRQTTLFSEWQILLCAFSSEAVDALSGLVEAKCVALCDGSSGSLAERYREAALACFERIRSLLSSRPSGRVLVQVVVSDDAHGRVYAGLSGLLKTAAIENPACVCQLLQVPSSWSMQTLALCVGEERAGGLEPWVRYGALGREVAGWREAPASGAAAPLFKDGGVYLITGGLGGLGRIFAQAMCARARGARVVLAGRGEWDGRVSSVLSGLSSEGGVVYRQVDLADAASVSGLVDGIVSEFGRLDGIVHGAGMVSDNYMLKKDAEEFERVLLPKVLGTVHLDEASAGVGLDWFVLFSSVVSVFGNGGQADYAAANGFMDGYAGYRSELVLRGVRYGRTVSVQWPLWASGGMRVDETALLELERRMGVRPLSTALGLEAFDRVLDAQSERVLVMSGDVSAMRRALRGEESARVVEDLEEWSGEASAADAERFLVGVLGEVLKIPPSRIDAGAGLEAYGIDSIMAMQLTTRLEEHFGSLPKTL
ncbi:MAG: SDR family NAD(P)-dependent oxidoreductase, partial [Candidatus Moraniibacteriota bacterium]